LNTYEMVSIIDVTREEEEGEQSKSEEIISQEIAKAGGEIMDIGSMGQRKLAYSIEDHTDGLYILSHFMIDPGTIVALRDSIKLNKAVIRNLIVRYKKPANIELETIEPEESVAELPEETALDVPTNDNTDDDISITISEETESLDDLNLEVNLDSTPAEDDTGMWAKEV